MNWIACPQYDMVAELQITFVTISHRLTLRERHAQVLAIGDGALAVQDSLEHAGTF
eukprot:SAG22_NODE_837_length_6911_cov_4.576629_12_plen_56_part_00